MSYIGDFRLGDTFDTKFCTVNTSGVPTTLAGTPVISAYVGNSTTQLTAGITLTVDFDAVTGMHHVRVVATSGNGYATASNYQLVITTGTVGGSSVVGYVVAEFSIEARSALVPTTAGRTLDVSATGEAGIDWANIGSPTTTVALTGTSTNAVTTATNLTTNNDKSGYALTPTTGLGNQTANITGTLSGNVGGIASGGIVASSFAAGAIDAAAIATDAIGSAELAASAVTEIQSGLATSAALATLQADTDDIQTRLPAALVSGRIDASVGAMASGVVTAAAIATGAVDADALAADAVTEISSGVWDMSLIPYLAGSNMGNSLYKAGLYSESTLVTAVWAKTLSELSAVPGVTTTTLNALNWLFTLHRNKRTETSAIETLFKDDGTTALATSTKSDDGTTFTAGEYS